ncbi:S41 family peptidase [Immundisolibacter cernigliae]|uniref:Peptidase S41 n=1 Tax=Immundisolibacter cernigliae TaxID=1810504 RepID=A0A1B1YQJ1_9GAMM|nr:S41 family peptidase [Immundisolibacter cernigliae]ANX03048.1 peptidase S41 [Immundisolibacter cernigliae]
MSKLLKASALIAVGFFCALLVLRDGAHAERSDPVPAGATMDLPVQELRLFSEVLGIIRQNYVEPVSDGDLLKSAIRGMLAGLDPHSAYLEQEEFQELKEGTSGEFGGLGIEVGMEDGFVKVVSPIDDTPAQKAGILAGDLIIRLDDTAVKGLSLNEAVKLMRGAPGTDITLTIVREGQERPLQIKLTRAVIKVNSVRSRSLDPGYGYLRVSQFQVNTGRKLRDAVTELKEKNGGALKGLVLDLRNNPGGVLTAAVSVSDAFISDGLIVYTEGRGPEAAQKFSATSGDILEGVPIVVLVNAGSASASEIVAGALQDNGRAIIMGEKTFGKGSVQTILPISESAALKLTTARYFTPKGRSIQAEGIEPDVPLERVQLTALEQPFQPLGERDLARHLDNPNGKAKPATSAAPKAAADQPATDTKEVSLAKADFGVHEALNLLKALNIVQSRAK